VRLVTVAHGTRHERGNEVARRLTSLAARQLGMDAVASYVELCEPSFGDVLASSRAPTVAVPLLLSTGFHVRHDLAGAVTRAGVPVLMAGPLGPHPLLAEAAAARLRAAGARRGQPVALVAAGSRDLRAPAALRAAVRLLEAAWDGSVTLATLSGPGPRPSDVVTPDHAVSPYLLAPGHFAAVVAAESARLDAAVLAGVLGAHPAVVRLVVERVRGIVLRLDSDRLVG
jgi:sirohydrochlorin ferrochelatase